MVCLGFKGGIGTASRTLSAAQGGYTVGVLVQCNFGARRDLRIAGVPVGEEITDLQPCIANNEPDAPNARRPRCNAAGGGGSGIDAPEQGSIIVVVATDAPLMPDQLKRVATRVALGVGRQGGFGGNGSGDIFVAFSTANPRSWSSDSVSSVRRLSNDRITPLFQATAQATEAAITNALLAAETTTGANDLRIFAMPVDRMLDAMRKYGRMK
jgi:L-aminopeptidase/D-esterase-like protein